MSRDRRRKREQKRSEPDARGIARATPVPHRPEVWAEARRCWDNVERKISSSGGSAVAGYLLITPIMPGLKDKAIKLVAHCVWRSPTKQLIDVSPHDLGDVHFFDDETAMTIPSAIQPLPGLEPEELQEVYQLAREELYEDCTERIQFTKEFHKRQALASDGQHKHAAM